MILNGNKLKDDYFSNQIFDFCVIGSGFAADSFVKSLNKKFKVLVVESGGFKNDIFSEKLNKYELTSKYFEHTVSRKRIFGGSSALWGGEKKNAKILNFSKNTFFSKRVWPINYSELNRFKIKTIEYFKINEKLFKDKTKVKKFSNCFDITPYFYQHPAKRINNFREKRYYTNCPNIILVYNLNLVDQISNEKKINTFIFKSRLKNLIKIKSKNFILSCGGIENARILLNFAKTDKSFKNKNVGRNFSEHLCIYPLIKIPKKQYNFKNNFTISPNIVTSRKYKIPDFTLQILNKTERYYKCFLQLEQNFNLKNSVSLSKTRDIFDLPISKLNWHLSKKDYENISKIQKLISNKLQINKKHFYDIKKFKLKFRNEKYKQYITTPHHHMCTTKMGFSGKNSVINKNMKFFNKNNLYILGSSTFSKPCAINPTFTIVQLSIRLGNYFNKKV